MNYKNIEFSLLLFPYQFTMSCRVFSGHSLPLGGHDELPSATILRLPCNFSANRLRHSNSIVQVDTLPHRLIPQV